MGVKDLDNIMIDTKANIIKTNDGFSETNMLLNRKILYQFYKYC